MRQAQGEMLTVDDGIAYTSLLMGTGSMRVLTGDETGLVKAVGLEGQRIVIAGRQTREREIKAMCWTRAGGDFAVARSDGVVTLWQDSPQGIKLGAEVKGLGGKATVGMAHLPVSDQLIVVSEEGSVKVSAPALSSADSSTFEVPGPLSCMAMTSAGDGPALMAVGGKERELSLWDVQQETCIWVARNVPHDMLDLRQPVWVNAVRYMDSRDVLAIGTAYKQLRVYDARSGRRPVKEKDLGGHRVMSIAGGVDGSTQVVTGDAAGTVLHTDIGTMKLLGRLEGPAGSVRALARHPRLPFIAVAGLDRMLRVYDLKKPRKQAYQYYLKQRVNCCLFAAEGVMRGGREVKERIIHPGDDEDGDVEAMEDEMESVGESASEDEGDDGGEKRDGQGAQDPKAAIQYERIYDEGSSTAGNSSGRGVSRRVENGGLDEDDDDDGDDDDDDEEEEDVVPFGRRNQREAQIELNVTGLEQNAGDKSGGSADEDEGAASDDDEEEDEDDDDQDEGEGDDEEDLHDPGDDGDVGGESHAGFGEADVEGGGQSSDEDYVNGVDDDLDDEDSVDDASGDDGDAALPPGRPVSGGSANTGRARPMNGDHKMTHKRRRR